MIGRERPFTTVGATINLFDGEENLETVVRVLKHSVAHINVVYSEEDNRRNFTNRNAENEVLRLAQLGLVDSWYRYSPTLSVSPMQNECIKRSIGFDILRSHGLKVGMAVDADEIYLPCMFEEEIVSSVEEGRVSCVLAPIRSYYKNICWYYLEDGDFAVPFLFSLDKYKVFSKDYKILYEHNNLRLKVDGSRRCFDMTKENSTYIPFYMEHLSYIRKDIALKFATSTCADNMVNPTVLQTFKEWEPGRMGAIYKSGYLPVKIRLKLRNELLHELNGLVPSISKHFYDGDKNALK